MNAGTRGVRGLISFVLLALIVTGVVAAKKVQDGPSAASVLDDARSFVRDHRTVRFTGSIVFKFSDGRGGLGAASTVKSKLTGEQESAARSHAVIDSGDQGAVESIAAGTAVYVREADTRADLPSAKYEKIDIDDLPAGVIRSETDQAKELDITTMLAAAHDPKKVSHSGKETTITAPVTASKLVGSIAAKDVDSITIRLVVHKGGEIHSVVQHTAAAGADITTTLRFKDWGRPVKIAEPSAEQIDPTPGIDEEELAAWDDSPLYMPKGIPVGWTFDGAGIAPADSTAEGCDEVELDYGDPSDPDAGYLTIYEFPVSCAKSFSGPGVTPFTAGPYSGFASSDEDGTLVQMTVNGKTTLQAETDLSRADLAVILKDLIPLNLKTKPVAIAGLGGKQSSA